MSMWFTCDETFHYKTFMQGTPHLRYLTSKQKKKLHEKKAFQQQEKQTAADVPEKNEASTKEDL